MPILELFWIILPNLYDAALKNIVENKKIFILPFPEKTPCTKFEIL